MNCAFILSKHFLIVKLPRGMFFLIFYIFCVNFSIILCYTNDCLFLTIPTHLHISGNLFSKTIEVNFMNTLLEQIKMQDATAFTHGGKFHADDVFSSALLL